MMADLYQAFDILVVVAAAVSLFGMAVLLWQRRAIRKAKANIRRESEFIV